MQALRDGDADIVAAAVSRAAHVVSMATLLSPAAGEAAGRGVLGTLAVSSHHALFITAAWIPLSGDVAFLRDVAM